MCSILLLYFCLSKLIWQFFHAILRLFNFLTYWIFHLIFSVSYLFIYIPIKLFLTLLFCYYYFLANNFQSFEFFDHTCSFVAQFHSSIFSHCFHIFYVSPMIRGCLNSSTPSPILCSPHSIRYVLCSGPLRMFCSLRFVCLHSVFEPWAGQFVFLSCHYVSHFVILILTLYSNLEQKSRVYTFEVRESGSVWLLTLSLNPIVSPHQPFPAATAHFRLNIFS